MIPALKVLLLILVANGAPILARKLIPDVGACPLDGGRTAWDARPLLGSHKTARGLIAALTATAIASLLIGLPLQTGVLVGTGAMAGDLASSFVKRRLDLAPGNMAFGLDQIPESLLPALLVADITRLTGGYIAAIVAGFIALEILLSRMLYRLRVRNRPY